MTTTILPRPPSHPTVPKVYRAPHPWKRRSDPWWAPKPDPLGERDGLPVIVGVVSAVERHTAIIRVACPWCDRWHQHGHSDAPNPDAGTRNADCGGGNYFIRVEPSELNPIEGGRRPRSRASGRSDRPPPHLRVVEGEHDR